MGLQEHLQRQLSSQKRTASSQVNNMVNLSTNDASALQQSEQEAC